MTAAAMRFTRYAVYWAPEDDEPLRAFGAAWLGHDPGMTQGTTLAARERLGLPDEFAAKITAEPRRYGLHATLKAPFRLAPHATCEQLEVRMRTLASSVQVFSTPPLRLTNLNGFLALCPSGPSRELASLADRSVTELDLLRAPLTEAERARRKPHVLSAEQRALLERWGYPYVLAHYRFHITLTDRLGAADRARVAPLLESATAPFCKEPFAVRSIALFGDPGGGQPFQLVQRFALAAA